MLSVVIVMCFLLLGCATNNCCHICIAELVLNDYTDDLHAFVIIAWVYVCSNIAAFAGLYSFFLVMFDTDLLNLLSFLLVVKNIKMQ